MAWLWIYTDLFNPIPSYGAKHHRSMPARSFYVYGFVSYMFVSLLIIDSLILGIRARAAAP